MNFNNNIYNRINTNMNDADNDILGIFLNSITSYRPTTVEEYYDDDDQLENFYNYYENNMRNPLDFIFNTFINDPIDTVLQQSFNEQQDNLTRTNRVIMISSQRFDTLDEQIMNNNKSCSICITDFEKEDMISITNCNHIFHTDCIKEWGKYKPECAMCREPLQ